MQQNEWSSVLPLFLQQPVHRGDIMCEHLDLVGRVKDCIFEKESWTEGKVQSVFISGDSMLAKNKIITWNCLILCRKNLRIYSPRSQVSPLIRHAESSHQPGGWEGPSCLSVQSTLLTLHDSLNWSIKWDLGEDWEFLSARQNNTCLCYHTTIFCRSKTIFLKVNICHWTPKLSSSLYLFSVFICFNFS